MADHAEPARKSAQAAAKAPAAGRGARGEILNRRSEAVLAGPARLLARRADANAGPRPVPPVRDRGPRPIQPPPLNRTGMPDRLKAGVERLSGLPMDDVRVHRSSSEPARLGALAYAHGSDIHLGPGQERHLPHEAWHVVQQKQGRVSATKQMKGVRINSDAGLEHEADTMGARALAEFPRGAGGIEAKANQAPKVAGAAQVVQRVPQEVNNLLQQNVPPDGIVVVNAVSERLEGEGVPHRFGGSLAARLSGARRPPSDLDVEVQNGDDVARAGTALEGLNGQTCTHGQAQAQISAVAVLFHANLYALLSLRFAFQDGAVHDVSIDISNENAPECVQGMQSPAQRGVQPGMGSLVSRPELMMNYLHRMINKPQVAEQKGDARQIAQLLISAGFDPADVAHAAELQTIVTNTFDANLRPQALNLLTQIINHHLANPGWAFAPG
ncbi:MAG TPA: DUF4157 domain-containing protein [Allosphingosinicella sp.]|nr:DUF4157 domain-containing protein [Allosphingosinicella sp.]